MLLRHGRRVFVTDCCRWCATELTGFKGIDTAAVGATTPVFLATASRAELCPDWDAAGCSGRFYMNCAPSTEFEREWAGLMPDLPVLSEAWHGLAAALPARVGAPTLPPSTAPTSTAEERGSTFTERTSASPTPSPVRRK